MLSDRRFWGRESCDVSFRVSACEVGGRVAHALGAGLRVDVAIFSFIERATFRFDVAKTINDSTPFQLWFGMQHAF